MTIEPRPREADRLVHLASATRPANLAKRNDGGTIRAVEHIVGIISSPQDSVVPLPG